MEILQELYDKVRLDSISSTYCGQFHAFVPCIKCGVEEFRSSSPLNLIYLLLYWEVFYFLDEPFSSMDALVLLGYFGIYGIWGLCGLSEIPLLLFFFLSIMDF